MPDSIYKIYGIELDSEGRCLHYHTSRDVAALLCAECHKYYACFKCHDELEDHRFKASDTAEQFPVMCGCCRTGMTKEQYKKGHCPNCGAEFNPRCSLHEHIYFCGN